MPEPGHAPKYDEAKVDELFIKALDIVLEGVKRRGLEANNFASEAEADATISNLRDMYLSIGYCIDDKIDTIKQNAPELMSQLLDAEEKPICG